MGIRVLCVTGGRCVRSTDCHTSDVGHWFAMTEILIRGAAVNMRDDVGIVPYGSAAAHGGIGMFTKCSGKRTFSRYNKNKEKTACRREQRRMPHGTQYSGSGG